MPTFKVLRGLNPSLGSRFLRSYARLKACLPVFRGISEYRAPEEAEYDIQNLGEGPEVLQK
jgi:hypothetical protein